MDTNKITVIIKYQGLDYYGKWSQAILNIPSNITLAELKERIAFKLKIPPENQLITLKLVNRILPLK